MACAVDDDDWYEDAVVGDFGEEGGVEVVECGAHIAVDLGLAVEECEGYAPDGVVEGWVVGEGLQELGRGFGADELAVLLWRGGDVAAGGDEGVAVEDDEGGARAVDDVGYV